MITKIVSLKQLRLIAETTAMALKKNSMKKRSGFKMRSGNKPDMTKLAGITKADSKQADGRAKSSAFQKKALPFIIIYICSIK